MADPAHLEVLRQGRFGAWNAWRATERIRAPDLVGANLSGADLSRANLVEVDLTSANLTGCLIYGASVWELKLSEETAQHNLIITKNDEPEITVDNIEIAQFIYLMLNNQKIRDVIDAVTSKAVLILGRFTPERKQVLDALRDELRKRNYLPIVFDFDKPCGARHYRDRVAARPNGAVRGGGYHGR